MIGNELFLDHIHKWESSKISNFSKTCVECGTERSVLLKDKAIGIHPRYRNSDDYIVNDEVPEYSLDKLDLV